LFARVLKCTARDDQARLARRVLIETDEANGYRLAHGRSHPAYGDGSLIARLMKMPVHPLDYGDEPAFLTALCIVADAVLTHNAAQETSPIV
jgi:hypothetical protein